MLSRRASMVLVTAVAAAVFGAYALAHSIPSAWSRQARAVRAPVSSLSPSGHHSRDLRPGFGAILASDPGRSDRTRPLFPHLPAGDRALQRQMQQLLDISAVAAKPPPVINAPPLPLSAGGTCFVASGGCSLVPCVELVQTSAVLQLNPPALAATTCLNHRGRGRGPLTPSRTEVVMDPITGTVVSMEASPVSVVMNPSTGTVVSFTRSQR